MREACTDERLDEMSRRMDAGFARVDADIKAFALSTGERFDALQRTLIQVGGGIIVALIALIATVVGSLVV